MNKIQFLVKRFVAIITMFCFCSSTFAQFVTNTYSDKPEPILNIPKDREIAKLISSQTKDIYLSKPEKDLLYWMNFARKYPRQFYDDVVCAYIKIYPELVKTGQNNESLKNDLYSAQPLPLLLLDENLTNMAREHASDVRLRNNPSIAHSSSSGLNFQQRAIKFGFQNVCLGENLSYGSGSVLMQLVLLYLDAGHADLGHRKNLLKPAFTNIGLASAQLDDGDVFFVQDFSCPYNK